MAPLRATRASPPSAALRARLRAGDRAAFDAFYDCNFRRVFTFAMRRTEDRVTAEWVTEATLTEALERLAEIHESEVPAAWLLGILQAKLAVACDPPAVVELPPHRWRSLLGGVRRRLARRGRRRMSQEAVR